MSGNTPAANGQMVRTTMAIPIEIGGGQTARINLPPGATLAGPVKVMTLANNQTIAHVTVMAPPGVVEKYVAQAAAESEKKEAQQVARTTPTAAAAKGDTAVKNGVLSENSPEIVKPERPSGPSNLFDKLNKPKTDEPIKKEQIKEDVKEPSSEPEDNIPLASLAKKTVIEKSTKPKKPQTGFGMYLEEHKDRIAQKFPRLSNKDVLAEVKKMWEKMDNSSKNVYIRNSEAYKIKKGIALDQPTPTKNKPIPKKPKVKELENSEHLSASLPKRNVKRRIVNPSEDEARFDDDWDSSEQNQKIQSLLPSLKFKKKSKTSSSESPITGAVKLVRGASVEDDLPMMFDENKHDQPIAPPPPSIEKKTIANTTKSSEVTTKESTPPPLTKKEPIVSSAPPEKRSSFKAMCLQDGCFEEVQISDERGKYWCSDRCCIQYSKVIFNAWITARKANMID